MESIKIENYEVGNSNPPFIIAEAGINHNGDIQKAFKMMSQNQLKSYKNWFWAPMCDSCCSHGRLGCPQADKMVPRVLKWRNQACQMIGFGHPK